MAVPESPEPREIFSEKNYKRVIFSAVVSRTMRDRDFVEQADRPAAANQYDRSSLVTIRSSRHVPYAKYNVYCQTIYYRTSVCAYTRTR